MKKLLLVPLLLILIVSGLVIWFYTNVQAVSSDKTFTNFVISNGESGATVAGKLQSQGFIKSALVFRLYLRATGQTNSIQIGEFRLSPSFTLFQIVDALSKGPLEVWVTIPEGLRREEIATRFTNSLGQNAAFTNDFLASSKGDEGMLFPDTYLFPKDASASSIVNKMTRTFGAKTANFSAGPGLTFDQRVILASILERETKTDAERPVVAGILINRLSRGMPLQVDATVQYAIGTPKNWWPVLGLSDLKINSRFNTYENTGLPPSPIANPGISSLTAAFNPSASDYLYYIHDATGVIHYAKTLQEHNANIAKYLGR